MAYARHGDMIGGFSACRREHVCGTVLRDMIKSDFCSLLDREINAFRRRCITLETAEQAVGAHHRETQQQRAASSRQITWSPR